MPLQQPCPCGSGTSYDACCGRLHRGAEQARTAEELMRSRYSAYAVGDLDHLFRTWHPRTRPDDEGGRVEFVAHWESADRRGALHEDSRFERRAGRWVYVDGEPR